MKEKISVVFFFLISLHNVKVNTAAVSAKRIYGIHKKPQPHKAHEDLQSRTDSLTDPQILRNWKSRNFSAP